MDSCPVASATTLRYVLAFGPRQQPIAHIVSPVFLRQALAAFQPFFLRIKTVFHIASARTVDDKARRFRGGHQRTVQYHPALWARLRPRENSRWTASQAVIAPDRPAC